ncbi:MAG: GNAT family N-acetyltransferase [Pseudomonadota bacterium]
MTSARNPAFVIEWHALSENAEIANPFFGPDCILSADEHGLHGALQLATLRREDGKLIALAPFASTRLLPLTPGFLRFFTHDYLPVGTPLCLQPAADHASLLMLHLTATFKKPFLLTDLDKRIFEAIAANEKIHSVLFEEDERAVIETQLSGDAYMGATLSKQRRKSLERRFRRLNEALQESGSPILNVFSRGDEFDAAFDAFLALENAGWKGRAGTSLLSNPVSEKFARQAISAASNKSAVEIAHLQSGERLVASLVVFRSKEKRFAWKIAYDEDLSSFSPGVQLLSRYARQVADTEGGLMLDSCSSSENAMANAIMGERRQSVTALIASSGATARTSAVASLYRARHFAKSCLRRLLSSS